ncbi:MAG: DALR domain-containing protein, partial [Pyrinomonadaceae bacterium]
QSEGATGKQFAKYWLHSEFLKIDDVTMSKSKGNFFTFRDLRDQGYSALAIRYLLLSVPTRKQLNFTFEGLQGAESTVERLRNFRALVMETRVTDAPGGVATESVRQAISDFESAMDDDFNTAAALAAIHDLVRDVNITLARQGLTAGAQAEVLEAVSKFDSVLGIFGATDDSSLDEEIEAIVAERQKARHSRDFTRSDQLRDELASKGIILEDTKDGVRWKRK